jgi:hypothetical protein
MDPLILVKMAQYRPTSLLSITNTYNERERERERGGYKQYQRKYYIKIKK